jgi:hypothetical protein
MSLWEDCFTLLSQFGNFIRRISNLECTGSGSEVVRPAGKGNVQFRDGALGSITDKDEVASLKKKFIK